MPLPNRINTTWYSRPTTESWYKEPMNTTNEKNVKIGDRARKPRNKAMRMYLSVFKLISGWYEF